MVPTLQQHIHLGARRVALAFNLPLSIVNLHKSAKTTPQLSPNTSRGANSDTKAPVLPYPCDLLPYDFSPIDPTFNVRSKCHHGQHRYAG